MQWDVVIYLVPHSQILMSYAMPARPGFRRAALTLGLPGPEQFLGDAAAQSEDEEDETMTKKKVCFRTRTARVGGYASWATVKDDSKLNAYRTTQGAIRVRNKVHGGTVLDISLSLLTGIRAIPGVARVPHAYWAILVGNKQTVSAFLRALHTDWATLMMEYIASSSTQGKRMRSLVCFRMAADTMR